MNQSAGTGFAPSLAERGGATASTGLALNKSPAGGTVEDPRGALIARGNRQIAEHRWHHPLGNNALETYQQLAREFPGNPVTLQFGVHLSAVLWSEARSAERAGRLDEAAVLLDALKTLPPVPVGVILGNDEAESPPRNMIIERLEPASSSRPDDSYGSAALIDPPNQTGSRLGTDASSARAAETSAATAARSLELASLAMTRGAEAMVHGDIITARRFFEVAASHNLAQAPAALGRTYDPILLREKGVRGLLADVEAARRWYQKAIENGDSDAQSHLDKLLGIETRKLDH
jgi:hypothetical protein